MTASSTFSTGVFSSAFSILLLIFVTAGVFTFPAYSIVLVVAIVSYIVALWFMPFLWLYVLLFITLAVNLAPWTGRYIVDELDIFVAVTGAFFLFQLKPKYKVSKQFYIATALVVFCFATSFDSSWFNVFSPAYANFYVTPLNGFIIFKGLLWALLLSWIFNQQRVESETKAYKHLFLASILGSLTLFVIIMWEKQVLVTLFTDTDIYTKVNTFFNLSSAYRTTGIISGMHTGGESIDGMYLFLLPLTVGACFFFKRYWLRFIALAAVVGVMYGVLMGFTRATYGASFIAITVVCLMCFVQKFREKAQLERQTKDYTNAKSSLLIFAVGYAVAFSLLFYSVYTLHQYAGYYAELSAGLMYSLCIYLGSNRKIPLFLKIMIVVIGGLLFFNINIDSFENSQWVDAEDVSSSSVYSAIGGCAVAFICLFALALKRSVHIARIGTETIVLVLVSILLAAAFFGARINIRAETSTRDLDTRLSHWQSIIDSGNWSSTNIFFGHGLGSMPTNYALSGAAELDRIGTFAIDKDKSVLNVIPGSDLMLTQRFNADSNEDYLLEIIYRANEKIKVAVGICRRNMIIFEFWAHGCGNIERIYLPPSNENESNSQIITLKATKDSFFALPAALTLKATVGDVPLEIDSISLLNLNGRELLSNASFSEGGDFWFFYYDFEHLAWHIKNLYLSFAYQFGVVGVLLILTLITATFIGFYKSEQLLSLPCAMFTAFLAGQFAFGIFGDPTDSARTAMWFYFIMFGALSSVPSKVISEIKEDV